MIECKYHPNAAARRHCNTCDIDLCHLCLKTQNQVREEFLCPVCENLTAHLGFNHNIQPFWLRIPAFFIYPFNASTMFYIAGLMLITFIGILFPVVGVLIVVFVFYAIFKYGFAVLEHTARGHLQPPDSGMGHVDKNNRLPLKQMLLLLSMGGLVWVTYAFVSPEVSLILAIFLAFMWPASTMLLGVTGNFFQAANPLSLLNMVSAIGFSYGLLYLLLLVISSFGWVLKYGIQSGLPLLIGLPLGVAVIGYFVVANFHLLGYVIYQYHEALGYNANQAFDEAPAEALPSVHSVESIQQEVDIVLSEHGYAAAKQRLKKKILSEPNNLEIHHYCHQFMLDHQDEPGIPRHAQQYIPLLIAQGMDDLMLTIARRCLQIKPKFKLKHASDALLVGKIAYDKADFDLALKVFTLFRQQFPGHKENVDTQFLCAKLYAQQLGDTAKAKMIMRSLVGRHSRHAKIEAMKAFLAEL